jgi:predicted transcriptional regulator
MSPNIALLSIHREYVDMIFRGEKKVELRKVRPRSLKKGDFVLVYATSPQRAIVGIFEIDSIIENNPQSLWNSVREEAGISYPKFMEYFAKSEVGFAIVIGRKYRFEKQLGLDFLREAWSNFHPPQCYKYLTNREVSEFESIAHFDALELFRQ